MRALAARAVPALICAPARSLTNGGRIYGGDGSYQGGIGGIGVQADGGKLTNTGTVTGGVGGYSYNVGPGTGGAGISLSGGAVLTSTGSITGGAGRDGHNEGTSGGAGVVMQGSALYAGGTISGGTGGAAANIMAALAAPVSISPAVRCTRAGRFPAAPAAMAVRAGAPGMAGTGVVLHGATVFVSGTVDGGSGGIGRGFSYPQGGYGVQIDGGSLVVSGTISGGYDDQGLQNDAVLFGSVAGSLTLDPSAVLNGLVAANATVNDVLALRGTDGTLTGLGSVFTGFTTLSEAKAALWTVTGNNTLGAGTQLLDSGTLSIGGTLTDAGIATVSGKGVLLAANGGFLHLAGVVLAGGTITTDLHSSVAIGGGTTHPAPGIIKIEAGFSIDGSGVVGSATPSTIVDNGMIASQGGKLVLATSVSGTGALTIDSGSALSAVGNVSTASLTFASGGSETLLVSAASTISTALSGFGAGDVIDVAKVANSLTFENGTLTLLQAGTIVEVLNFSGSYSQGGFALSKDGHGGTDVTYGGSHADAIDAARIGASSAFEMRGYGMWHDIAPSFDR